MTPSVEQAFADRHELYQQITMEIAEKVRESIPEALREVFDVLSLFRRYTSRLLECILDQELITYDGNAYILEKDMLAAYLVKRHNGFVQDEIVRRLLATRLLWKNRELFLRICRSAVNIYKAELRRGSRRPAVLIAEALYQVVRLRYYKDDQSLPARQTLRAGFFKQDGILDQYLAYIVSDQDAYDVKQNFLALLRDSQTGDWELRFAINFFLRGADYTDAPYERLRERATNLNVKTRSGHNDSRRS